MIPTCERCGFEGYLHICEVESPTLPKWPVNRRGDPIDPVNHPKHYTSNASGVECIDVAEHMSFNAGNAMKYLFRHNHKGDPIEDLEKAKWYVQREIDRLKAKA